MKALDKLAGAGNLRKIVAPTRDALAKISADYQEMRKSIAPLFEKIAKLERRVEEVEAETRPVPPPILRRHEPQPVASDYDQMADTLEKLAHEGMGAPLADAAHSTPALGQRTGARRSFGNRQSGKEPHMSNNLPAQLDARLDHAIATHEAARHPLTKAATRADLVKIRDEIAVLAGEQSALAAIKSAPRGDMRKGF